jgi:hypothetical protein
MAQSRSGKGSSRNSCSTVSRQLAQFFTCPLSINDVRRICQITACVGRTAVDRALVHHLQHAHYGSTTITCSRRVISRRRSITLLCTT